MDPRRAVRAPASGADESPGALGTVILVTLALLLAARAATAFVPGMWAWSLHLARWLHPALGWGTWALAALALAPPVARALAGPARGAGEAIARGSRRAAVAAAIVAALLVWSFPDVVRFVGDFLIRQGTVEVAEKPSVLFPQALPLDVFLHHRLPSELQDRGVTDANGAARLLGLVEAALLALLAVRAARLFGARGAAALAVTVVVACGGYLGMYTGFGKAFAELALLTAWAGVAGIAAIREGRGLLALGLAVAIAATLHRSGLALAPAAALAWVLWARRHGAGAWRRPVTWLAVAVPVAALAVMIPRIAAIARRWDVEHFRPGGASGGALAALTFTPARFADIANLLLMLVPLLPVALAAGPALLRGARRDAGREAGAGAELAFLIALALPFLAVMPVLHPAQGMFRDWDDFAATGTAVALLTAWVLARALHGRPAWVAVAVAVSGVAPTIQWLAAHRDLDRGLERVRAFVTEAPARTPSERGITWDFIGVRYFRRGQEADRDGRLDEARRHFTRAVEAFASAAETAPSPRILQEWALAATMQGDFALAQRVYRRFLDKDPDNVLGWLGLATVSLNRGDTAEARRATLELLRLRPGEPYALELLEKIAAAEARGRAPAP